MFMPRYSTQLQPVWKVIEQLVCGTFLTCLHDYIHCYRFPHLWIIFTKVHPVHGLIRPILFWCPKELWSRDHSWVLHEPLCAHPSRAVISRFSPCVNISPLRELRGLPNSRCPIHHIGMKTSVVIWDVLKTDVLSDQNTDLSVGGGSSSFNILLTLTAKAAAANSSLGVVCHFNGATLALPIKNVT